MDLNKETRSLIAAELSYLTVIEIQTFLGNDYPKPVVFFDSQMAKAQYLRQAAEHRLNVIVDDLELPHLRHDISRLIQELDLFVHDKSELFYD